MKMHRVSAVIIGRNEGNRLLRCLESLKVQGIQLVYVDSGSTDNSVQTARGMGADVVALDMTKPFTAARARNEGFEQIKRIYPETEYAQFLDGDCEIVNGWIDKSVAFLDQYPEVAAVCGRRRERFPERTIYNKLCDMEWDTPVGETKACGGDVLMRLAAFESVSGFRPSLIAGEEPELCVRLRAAGWKIWRLDEEMTLHDAGITRFSQWWKRNVRAGYAFAEGAFLHGAPPERHWVKESRRCLIWGLAIPVIAIVIGIFCLFCGLIIALVYPLQVIRLSLRNKKELKPLPWLSASFSVLGKFAEAQGQLRFHHSRLLGRVEQLIEYK
jgi:glycosyltransferase involved in cell wall biosynthesis